MKLSDILSVFKKTEEGGEIKENPFVLKSQFIPFRLNAYKTDSTDLHMKLKNKAGDSVLTSVVVTVPAELGLDQMGLQKQKEIRLGDIKKTEEKEIVIPIWGTVTTKPGTYIVTVSANAHYRTYSYIQNTLKKKIELRVVK